MSLSASFSIAIKSIFAIQPSGKLIEGWIKMSISASFSIAIKSIFAIQPSGKLIGGWMQEGFMSRTV